MKALYHIDAYCKSQKQSCKLMCKNPCQVTYFYFKVFITPDMASKDSAHPCKTPENFQYKLAVDNRHRPPYLHSVQSALTPTFPLRPLWHIQRANRVSLPGWIIQGWHSITDLYTWPLRTPTSEDLLKYQEDPQTTPLDHEERSHLKDEYNKLSEWV